MSLESAKVEFSKDSNQNLESEKNLERLIDEIQGMGFWARLFSWSRVNRLSQKCAVELSQLRADFRRSQEELHRFEAHQRELQGRLSEEQEKNKKLDHGVSSLQSKLETLHQEKTEREKRISSLEQREQERREHFEQKISELTSAQRDLREEKERRERERVEKEEQRRKWLKETWVRHESEVEENIRSLCKKHQIDYVDRENLPFNKKPDNTIRICDELVVFDAKSPQGEELSNFRNYLKAQAEAAKKYAKEEGVRKDIFLVVPQNAIHVVPERSFDLADFRVYVITLDALEPILLSLQKIETYEFAEKLSPEDRESIVTVIGKMAHGMKRRIQIDQFFSQEFLDILRSGEHLPESILEEAKKIEKSNKLNPPLDKRSKEIPVKALQRHQDEIGGESRVKGINTQEHLEKLNQIPLFVDQES
jgi:hypothetical protein